MESTTNTNFNGEDRFREGTAGNLARKTLEFCLKSERLDVQRILHSVRGAKRAGSPHCSVSTLNPDGAEGGILLHLALGAHTWRRQILFSVHLGLLAAEKMPLSVHAAGSLVRFEKSSNGNVKLSRCQIFIPPRSPPCSFLPPPPPGDAYYLAIGGGVAEHNWNHIQTVLQDQGFRCQVTDHSEDMGMISIQGPKR